MAREGAHQSTGPLHIGGDSKVDSTNSRSPAKVLLLLMTMMLLLLFLLMLFLLLGVVAAAVVSFGAVVFF